MAPHAPPSEHYPHHHRNIQGGGARAAVFGVSDGLVTNVALILGVAAAHPAVGVVRLAGLAALIGGAFSMSAGEFVSMRAQVELLERELEFERHEIHARPDNERSELVEIYEDRGVSSDLAQQLATELMRDPDVALETHAREELGINPSELGSAAQASFLSFVTFAVGAFLPLIPWLVTTGTPAILASIVIGVVASLAVGFALSVFTGRSWWYSALRQLGLAVVAAGVTYSIGRFSGIAKLH